MAKAPSSSAKKGKDDKTASKSRSSASEVTKEKSKSKDSKKLASSIRPNFPAEDTAAAPVKSVLKESRPVPSFNLVQEQDFPRGAPAPASKAVKSTKDHQQPPQEKGLFDVSIVNPKYSYSADLLFAFRMESASLPLQLMLLPKPSDAKVKPILLQPNGRL